MLIQCDAISKSWVIDREIGGFVRAAVRIGAAGDNHIMGTTVYIIRPHDHGPMFF